MSDPPGHIVIFCKREKGGQTRAKTKSEMPSEFITSGPCLDMLRFAALWPRLVVNLEFQDLHSMVGRRHTKREVRQA